MVSQVLWFPRKNGVWKTNTNVSWCDRVGVGGIIWIVRDLIVGSLVCMGCQKKTMQCTIKNLEALTTIRDLSDLLLQAIGYPFPPLIVELNCVELVSTFNHKGRDLSELSCLVEEIVSLVQAA